jgi:hypothetical protein
VAESLERKCKAPTAEQITIARALGLPLGQATPAPVAAAELRVLLRMPLGLTLAGDFGDDEYEVLLDLANRTDLAVPDMDKLGCREVLNAWLRVARDRESAAALRRLEPAVDDVVTARDRRKGPGMHGEISSIGANGRLHFRGGHGLGTAPHRVTPVRTAISISSIWPANTPLRFRATRLGLPEPRRHSWNAGGSTFQRPRRRSRHCATHWRQRTTRPRCSGSWRSTRRCWPAP